MSTINTIQNLTNQEYKWGFVTSVEEDKIPKGLNEDVVRLTSAKKGEPEFMLDWRLKSYRHWSSLEKSHAEPKWANVKFGPIDYQNMVYYSAPKKKLSLKSLEEVDPEVLRTYDRLGIPLAEQQRLAGVAVDAVFDSVSVATTFKEKLAEAGVIFCSFSEAVQNHPELVKKYLGSVVPYTDNFFATLNSAVFSDGSFCYIPKGVRCPMELSTYFRIDAENTGQFERTLIVAEEGAYVSYLEGCTAPRRDKNQLHAAVVELVLVAPGRGAALEVADVRALLRDDQCALELAGVLGVDAEVGRQLHRTAHALRDVAEGAVAEDRGVERGEEVVRVGDHRPEVLLDQLRMVLHRLGERAEDDACLGQLLLEGGGHRDAVEDGVHRDAGEHLLLLQRNAELAEGLEQLGIDLLEALRPRPLRLGRRVVDDVLVVDGRVADVLPARLLHAEPVVERLEAPLEHELGLVLLRRDEADDVFVQPARDGVRLDVGDEPVLVLPGGQVLESLCGGAHDSVLKGKVSGWERIQAAISGSLRSRSLSVVLCSARCIARSTAIQSERMEQSSLRTQVRSLPVCWPQNSVE